MTHIAPVTVSRIHNEYREELRFKARRFVLPKNYERLEIMKGSMAAKRSTRYLGVAALELKLQPTTSLAFWMKRKRIPFNLCQTFQTQS